MTLEASLNTILSGIALTFPDFAPADTPLPYITYQQIGGDAVSYLGKEVSSKENAVMQITVWAASRKDAKAAIKAAEAALVTSGLLQATAVAASISDYEAGLPAYSSQQDFSIWADRQ